MGDLIWLRFYRHLSGPIFNLGAQQPEGSAKVKVPAVLLFTKLNSSTLAKFPEIYTLDEVVAYFRGNLVRHI